MQTRDQIAFKFGTHKRDAVYKAHLGTKFGAKLAELKMTPVKLLHLQDKLHIIRS